MWPNPQETADLVTFTEEIRNGKPLFCAVTVLFKPLDSNNQDNLLKIPTKGSNTVYL